MAKRRADKQLNDRNWDDEDPVEEAGVFERASDDILAKRTIRRAKRNLPQSGKSKGKKMQSSIEACFSLWYY